jgi:tetratricopeptide (TPR) repeat protein
LIGLIVLCLATAQPACVCPLAAQESSKPFTPSVPADPVEKEYDELLLEDDAAQAEVDAWIQQAPSGDTDDHPFADATLELRIKQRFDTIRRRYESFLQRHPKHARAFVAYGSFLHDIGEELAAKARWEQALEIDPTLPAAWNNLANYYGHRGPVKKAFEFYEKAIELDPAQSLYYHNFGTTVYLFRKDVREYYGITEQEVFDKALNLYDQAMELDPDNFLLASDVAQTFYGIRPMRLDDALAAWRKTYSLARDDIERQGIELHFARLKLGDDRFNEAREHLSRVTHPMYQVLKERLERNIRRQESPGTEEPTGADVIESKSGTPKTGAVPQ